MFLKIKIIVPALGAFAALVLALTITQLIGELYYFANERPTVFAAAQAGRVGLLFAGLVATGVLFLNLIRSSVSERSKGWAVTLCTVVALFTVAESIMMFVGRSFGSGIPLVEQNWFRYHWKPLNRLEYRDDEIESTGAGDEKRIMVVGDSFVAGHGIADYRDRFSNQLQTRLPGGVRVYNLGRNGSDTIDEFERLNAFPLPPDIVILSHVINDIERVAPRGPGRSNRSLLERFLRTPPLAFVVNNSYTINYLYWRYYMPAVIRNDRDLMENNPVYAYLEEDIMTLHLANLEKFVTYSTTHAVPLVVVIFPSMSGGMRMTELAVSRPIARFFREHGVPVLNVYDLVADLPPHQRPVNASDAHPSVRVHHLVAEALTDLVAEHRLLDGPHPDSTARAP